MHLPVVLRPPPPDHSYNPWESAFKEGELPAKNELSCGSVMKHVLQARQSWQQRRIHVSSDELRQQIKEETESYNLVLRGPVQVAQGEKSIIAVSSDQSNVLGVLFGAYPDILDKKPVYARVQKAGGPNEPDIEAQVKYVIGLKPRTIDHLVISQGLAKTLGVETGKEIKILETYQKPEDLNLDNL